MKKTRILTRLYGVTPMIVLHRNIFKARHVTQQDYSVTSLKVYAVTLLLWKAKTSESTLRRNMTLDYAVTSFKAAIRKVHVSSLWRKPLKGRKAHLLKDKQIPNIGVFDEVSSLGWHLEEIDVTWAHLGKKRTRLQLYTKVDEEIAIQWLDTASQIHVTASDHQRDSVWKIKTAPGLNRHSETLEDLAKRRRQDYNVTPSRQNWRDLPRDNLIVRVEVL
ncbi:hypothetical protein Tco_0914412, partial [Tanacetum coccineum]